MTDQSSAKALQRNLATIEQMLGQNFTHGGDLDYSLLDDKNEYAMYFALLRRVFNTLLGWYRCQETNGNTETRLEAEFVNHMLSRLLNTVEALRLKYTYDPDHRLRVDLTASGLPNNLELDNIRTDLQTKQERLVRLPAMAILQQALLDQLLMRQKDSPELLAQISQRSYLELIDESQLLLPFTLGKIMPRKTKRQDVRSYVCYWSCYDFSTNLPYIHIMTFDQDIGQTPLEPGTPTYQEFLEVIASEGSRAPKVGILALAIDNRLESIHPKIIKRICLGPLYAPFLIDDLEISSDPWQTAWQALMAKVSRRPDDFVLHFTDEVVFSKQQQVSRRGLFSQRVREVFYLDELNPESYEHQASVVRHYVLLPHYLLQQAVGDECLGALRFDNLNKVTYNEEGAING
jgi:hypothetical protein